MTPSAPSRARPYGRRCSPRRAVTSAISLSWPREHRLFLDLPRETLETVLTRLRRYKLRANVELDDLSGAFRVYAAWNGMPPPVPVTAPDPRLPEAGCGA